MKVIWKARNGKSRNRPTNTTHRGLSAVSAACRFFLGGRGSGLEEELLRCCSASLLHWVTESSASGTQFSYSHWLQNYFISLKFSNCSYKQANDKRSDWQFQRSRCSAVAPVGLVSWHHPTTTDDTLIVRILQKTVNMTNLWVGVGNSDVWIQIEDINARNYELAKVSECPCPSLSSSPRAGTRSYVSRLIIGYSGASSIKKL